MLGAAEAEGAPVFVNSYLAYGFKTQLAQRIPAGIAVKIAFVFF
jgi:hypothetical protein